MAKKKNATAPQLADVLVEKYFTCTDTTARRWVGKVRAYMGCHNYGMRLYLVEMWHENGESPRQQIVSTADMRGWTFYDSAPDVAEVVLFGNSL